MANPLRRSGRAPHHGRRMGVRLRRGSPVLARLPCAGRVRPEDAFDDFADGAATRLCACRRGNRRDAQLRYALPRHGGESARRGRTRLRRRNRRRRMPRLCTHPLRERREARNGEDCSRRRDLCEGAVCHAVALHPRGEGCCGACERAACRHGCAERAVAHR